LADNTLSEKASKNYFPHKVVWPRSSVNAEFKEIVALQFYYDSATSINGNRISVVLSIGHENGIYLQNMLLIMTRFENQKFYLTKEAYMLEVS